VFSGTPTPFVGRLIIQRRLKLDFRSPHRISLEDEDWRIVLALLICPEEK
jgi:hypothetical protein